MKIVIAGGDTEAEYIINSFAGKGVNIIVVNESKEVSERIMRACGVGVTNGTPWRKHILEQADAYDADVFIALNERDEDNFATCMIAKKVFNAKKCICVVHNPKNVDIFKELGIDRAISSTYLLAESIRKETTRDDFIKTLSLDNDRLSVLEFTVLTTNEIAYKKIRDIHFPNTLASIAAIKRGLEVIIPNGDVTLQPKDVLTIVCPPQNASPVTSFLSKVKERVGTHFSGLRQKRDEIISSISSLSKNEDAKKQVASKEEAVSEEETEEEKIDHKEVKVIGSNKTNSSKKKKNASPSNEK